MATTVRAGGCIALRAVTESIYEYEKLLFGLCIRDLRRWLYSQPQGILIEQQPAAAGLVWGLCCDSGAS